MLAKYNRTTVARDSGEVVGNATVKFYSQLGGNPVSVYSDVDGNNSLGNEIQSDPEGRVGVFATPGIYRIVIEDAAGNQLEELTYELIASPLAASSQVFAFQTFNHMVSNVRIFGEENSSNIEITIRGLDYNDAGESRALSVNLPAKIDFQYHGNIISRILTTNFMRSLPSGQSLGYSTGQTARFFIYAVTNNGGPFELAISESTLFDERETYSTTNWVSGAGTYNPEGLNSFSVEFPNGDACVRLIGEFTAVKTSSGWGSPDVIGYTGSQTHMTTYGRRLAAAIDENNAKDILEFTTIGKSMVEIPDVPGTRFLRINSNETVTARTQADFRFTDLQAAGLEVQNTFSQNQLFESNVTINGDLLVQGNTVQVDAELVTADTVVMFNDGEPGPGVTAGFSGIEIDRGSATNYQFGFQESNDTFRIGQIGDLQAVATRNDSMTNGRVAIWNSSANRLDSTDTLGFELRLERNGYEQLTIQRGGIGDEWGLAFSSFTNTLDLTRNDVVVMEFHNDEGIVVGGANGGSQGAASLNASGLYVGGDGVLTLASDQTISGSKTFDKGFITTDSSETRTAILHYPAVRNTSSNSVSGTLLITLPNQATDNTFVNLRILILDSYDISSQIEVGGYARSNTTGDWGNVYVQTLSTNKHNIDRVRFGYNAAGNPVILISNAATPTSSSWESYPAFIIEKAHLAWTGADNVSMRDASLYDITETTSESGITVTLDINKSNSSVWTTVWTNENLAQPMTLNTNQIVTGRKTFTETLRTISFEDGGEEVAFFEHDNAYGMRWRVRGANGFVADDLTLHNNGGLSTLNATGGSQGAGTINCKGIYKDGVEITGGGGGGGPYNPVKTQIFSGSSTLIDLASIGAVEGFLIVVSGNFTHTIYYDPAESGGNGSAFLSSSGVRVCSIGFGDLKIDIYDWSGTAQSNDTIQAVYQLRYQ